MTAQSAPSLRDRITELAIRDRADVALAAWCQIARPGTCTGRAQHRHHVVLQSQGGRGGPTLDVCHACHDYAHLHRAEARAHGWIIDRQVAS